MQRTPSDISITSYPMISHACRVWVVASYSSCAVALGYVIIPFAAAALLFVGACTTIFSFSFVILGVEPHQT